MSLNDARDVEQHVPGTVLADGIGVPSTIRIVIATHIRLYREGLVLILARHSDLVVAGWATAASDTVARIRETDAQVVLVDMAMPESQSLAREITASTPEVRVV